MLEVSDLNCYYGSIHALKGLDFEVHEGEIVALIGANGAGKSTTLKAICGLVPAESGRIVYRGKDIANIPPYRSVSLGMAHVPEGRQVFPELSVMDNLVIGGFSVKDKRLVARRIGEMLKRFPRLAERRRQMAGTLSGGEQQMLAIARGLVSGPQLLLLDEPSMGLAPMLVSEVFDIVQEINETGTTILLVEQNARMALSIADRAYVLETGRIVVQGLADEVAGRDDVQRAYLGLVTEEEQL